MQIKKTERYEHGIIIHFDNDLKLRLAAFENNIVRISASKTEFGDSKSLIVTKSQENIPFTADETDDSFIFSTDSLKVSISKKDFVMTFYNAEDKQLLKTARLAILMEKKNITVPSYKTSEGTKTEHVKTDIISGYSYQFRMKLDDDEQINGLGASDVSIYNRKNANMHMMQYNYFNPVPFMVSDKGYGILFDSCAYSTFRMIRNIYRFHTEAADMADMYFVVGDYDTLIKGYRSLTGEVPMFPKWLFGYVQSKEHYHTQKELLDILKTYREQKIPIDLIVQDWFYWKPDTWSDKYFDSERYPDPEGMCKEVHDNNAHIMVSVWPNTRNGDSYRELAKADAFLGDGEVYNVFDDNACDAYWKQLYEGMYKKGFDAWWCDCSEPYENGWGDNNDEEESYNIALVPYRKFMDLRKINAFSLLHCKNVYEHQRKVTSNKRVVNLTRASYAGQQRYSNIVWSGDITGTWETLKTQVSEGLNFCCSGIPYWTVDAGGFYVFKNDERAHNIDCEYESKNDLGFYELYTRWMQYSCFLPMFRSHGTDLPREVWHFKTPDNMFYDSLRKTIELRYRLIPYIYSLAWKITDEAYTLMRPLCFDFTGDKKAVSIWDEYMFGPTLLVCPVLEPMYYTYNSEKLENTEKTREVYLPKGTLWYDYYTHECFEGGTTVFSDAPIDRIPLFAKGGSILTETDVMQYVDESPDSPYRIYIFKGADASFKIYEDEGDSYNYEKGEYATYLLNWKEKDKCFEISKREGEFEGMVKNRKLEIHLVSENEDVIKEILYDGNAVSVRF